MSRPFGRPRKRSLRNICYLGYFGRMNLLPRCGLTLDWIRKEVRKVPYESQVGTDPMLSEAARKAILLAVEEREHLCHKHSGTEHLLLGIICSGTDTATILGQRGLTIDRARDLVRRRPSGRKRVSCCYEQDMSVWGYRDILSQS